MFKAHQEKYSFINKHQDNLALLALLILLNPSAETERGLQAQTSQHLRPDSPSGMKPRETRACHSQLGFFSVNSTLAGCGKVQMGLYTPSWCTLPTNTSICMVLDHIREDRQACSSLCCEFEDGCG